MTTEPKTLYLVAAPPQAAALGEALAERGFAPVVFATAAEAVESLLESPPWGVVVWEEPVPTAAHSTLLQVLRHHFDCRECAVVLVSPAAELAVGPSHFPVLAEPPDPAALVEALHSCAEVSARGPGRIPRILVVDDEQSIVLLGSHIVSSLGMIPLVAFDGPQAVSKASQLQPDLILLDINMPGMDGFQVLDALKADTGTRLIPVIVFSARKREEDKVRALKMGADDYVTKPFSIIELSARIDRLLDRSRARVAASSTTGLPGSVSIEQVLMERVERRLPLAVLYLDADHFKAFNDRYGFTRGDSVIRQIAELVLDAAREWGNPDDFVGHIGGDDFVVISTPARAVGVAEAVVERFDKVVPYYYDRADREAGGIETQDRKGNAVHLPLMTISIAIVTNEGREFHHAGEVADVAVELKRYAKSQPRSLWVKDKRTSGEGAEAVADGDAG